MNTQLNDPIPKRVARFGWKPGMPDFRDRPMVVKPTKLPSSFTLPLGQYSIAPYDQGELGSCTANAIAFLLEWERAKQNMPSFTPSRLMIYYLERAMEGTISEDSGAEIRDGMKAIAKYGACDEKLWPYIISHFTKKPPAADYKAALDDQALEYLAVNSSTSHSIAQVLFAGYPVAFGFSVYESFMSDEVERTGIVPMPKKHEQQIGGHAVALVGYNNTTQQFYVRNSWGTDWGMAGYFKMPYGYVTNKDLADDFWCVKKVG